MVQVRPVPKVQPVIAKAAKMLLQMKPLPKGKAVPPQKHVKQNKQEKGPTVPDVKPK